MPAEVRCRRLRGVSVRGAAVCAPAVAPQQHELSEQCRRLGMGEFHSPQFDYNPFTFREDSPEFIGPVYLVIPFARAEAQQGLFTIAGRLGLFHDSLLRELLADRDFGKLVIPSGLKGQLLDALRARGVTATSLQHVGADRLGFTMSQERGAPPSATC